MASNSNIEKIKANIKNNIGNNYDIIAKRGRKKVLLENCTIDSVYPSIFVIKTKDERSGGFNSISFSYIDILTKNVCLFPAFSIKGEKGA